MGEKTSTRDHPDPHPASSAPSTPGPSAGMAAKEAPPPRLLSPAQLKLARDLVQLLAKTARAVRIYARNNEVYQRFWHELQVRMFAFLEQHSVLALQVGVRELRVQGEVVFEPRETDDSFAFRLYKDGLRQIDFHNGLSPEELEQFLGIITTDFERSAHQERDVVSLLWECDFKHILTLSVDSFVQEAEQEGDQEEKPPSETDEPVRLEDIELDQLLSVLQQSAEVNLLKLDLDERREYLQVRAGLNSFSEREAHHAGRIFEIDVHQIHTLCEEVELAGIEETPIATIAEYFFELFRQELPEDYPELVQLTLGVLDSLLEQGDLESVNSVLFPLRMLSLPQHARAFLHHSLVLELFSQLSQRSRLELLTPWMNRGEVQGGAGAVFGFVSVQLPEQMPTLLSWLEDITHDGLRRAAVDALLVIVGDELDPLRPGIRSSDPALVADILRALGRIGNPQSLEAILGAGAHPDARVREEALIALRPYQSPRTREVMLQALGDPASAVRVAALRYLTVARDRQAGRMLAEMIGSRTFRERDFSEMRAICMALAYIQGDECLGVLSPLLKLKRATELQRAAAHGLSVVASPEARRALEQASREADPAVAFECQSLLSRL